MNFIYSVSLSKWHRDPESIQMDTIFCDNYYHTMQCLNELTLSVCYFNVYTCIIQEHTKKWRKQCSGLRSIAVVLEAILQCRTSSSWNVQQQVSDEFDSFGRSVVQTRHRLGGCQQAWVKITELLFEADFREPTAGGPSFEQVGAYVRQKQLDLHFVTKLQLECSGVHLIVCLCTRHRQYSSMGYFIAFTVCSGHGR